VPEALDPLEAMNITARPLPAACRRHARRAAGLRAGESGADQGFQLAVAHLDLSTPRCSSGSGVRISSPDSRLSSANARARRCGGMVSMMFPPGDGAQSSLTKGNIFRTHRQSDRHDRPSRAGEVVL
jgi:hypothetical protein